MEHIYPKVTIGLCVKNGEETIKECIESIVNQNYPHESLEIIVVDGCSKDNTLPIIEETRSKAKIRNEIFFENEGLGKARQIVVNQSGGDYIVWVDGDMVIPKSYVRKHVEFMENNPNVGIAVGRQRRLPDDNLVSKLEDIMRTVSVVKWGEETAPKMVATAGSIYRVKAIEQVGGFDVQMKSGEDREISYRVRLAGWSLRRNTQNIFYEKLKYNRRVLWKKYFWYGYGWYSLLHKIGNYRVPIQRLPLIGFINGLMLSIIAHKMIGKRWVFLLPLHFMFMWTAWYCGLIKAYITKYFVKNERANIAQEYAESNQFQQNMLLI